MLFLIRDGMASRRMTSLEVIDTDAFLDMPVSSQNLYFHLNARADDDGFVAGPKKIVRALGAATDDLKVLVAKKFLIEFNDGVCVIKHWRINNFIRKDIYKETQYLDLKQTLFIRPNGAYTLSDDERSIPIPMGHFNVEAVESTLTQRQLRIGKVREDTSVAIAPRFEVVTESQVEPIERELGDSKSPRISGDKLKAYNELIAWSENERGFKFLKTHIKKQYKAFQIANDNRITRQHLMERWEEMASEKFWIEKGFDWMNVVESFNRKPI